MKQLLSVLGLTGLVLCQGCCHFGRGANSCCGDQVQISSEAVMGRWVCLTSSLEGVQQPERRPRRALDLTLEQGGKVYGCSGVNRYFGTSVFAPEGQVRFEQMGATKMMGPGIGYEDAYLQALGKVRKYDLRDGLLVLLDQDGKVLLQFKR